MRGICLRQQHNDEHHHRQQHQNRRNCAETTDQLHGKEGDESKGQGYEEAGEEEGGGGKGGKGEGECAEDDVDAHASVESVIQGSGAPRQPALEEAPLACECGLKPRRVAAVDGESTGQLGAYETHGQREDEGNHAERNENIERAPPSHHVLESDGTTTHVEEGYDGQAPDAELARAVATEEKGGLVCGVVVVCELEFAVGAGPVGAAHYGARWVGGVGVGVGLMGERGGAGSKM